MTEESFTETICAAIKKTFDGRERNFCFSAKDSYYENVAGRYQAWKGASTLFVKELYPKNYNLSLFELFVRQDRRSYT